MPKHKFEDSVVHLEKCKEYKKKSIITVLSKWKSKFEKIIKSGDTVILKPNWIAESHKYEKDVWVPVVTNPDIITAVLQIVLEILDGKGKVIITDGPQTSSSWEKIMSIMNPDKWVRMGQEHSVNVSILDLREDEWIVKGDLIIERRKLIGDPLGSTICNLAEKSEFMTDCRGLQNTKYCGADYDTIETNEAHSGGNHFYKVSRTVLEADVFVNLPKLKTHKKAGITCSLKNLVGINTYKNWLPHHVEGFPEQGGDQYPDNSLRNRTEGSLNQLFYGFLSKKPNLAKYMIPVKKIAKSFLGDARKTIRSGNWHGNDTLWRTVLDLNKILFYANGDGSFRDDDFHRKKKYISIVDAVVSGERNGPEAPDIKNTGFLVMGANPVSVDAVCAKMMGFDWRKIPIIYKAFGMKNFPICDFEYNDIRIMSSAKKFQKKISEISPDDTFRFEPSIGWCGKIEEN